jgi:hypothetical protein
MERIPKPTPKSMNKKVLRKCETAQPLENIGDFALFKRGLRNRWDPPSDSAWRARFLV